MKKNNLISFATTNKNKEELTKLAKEKEWTMSQLCHKIINEYLESKDNNDE